jgi:hypothetical protein
MADNVQRYGFRWVRGSDGGKAMPTVEEHTVATGASFDINGGASNVSLGKGDVVQLAATGTAILCDGVEGAGGSPGLIPYGVVVGIKQYWDGTRLRVSPELLPSDVAWGTNRERATKIWVLPITGCVWEVDCNATAAGFDTEAEYEDMIGENVNMIHDITATNTRPTPRLDIANQATTNTFMFRIVGISKCVENADFTGNYVKLHVIANRAQRPWSSATGV